MPIVIIDQHYGLQSSEAKMIANAASNTRALSPQELPDYLRLAIQIGGSSWSCSVASFRLCAVCRSEQIQRPAFCNGR